MDKEYKDSSSMCCCGRSEFSYRNKCTSMHQRDFSSEDEKESNKYSPSRYNHFYMSKPQPSNYHSLEDQSWKSVSIFRGKPCVCSKLELEEPAAADPPCSRNPYANEHYCRNASLLRRANDVINYVPESEFLKKMKQQCQYLENSEPNIFFTIDDLIENDVSSYECQKCGASSNLVSRQRSQPNDKIKSASESSWKCTCSQRSYVTNGNDGQVLNRNFTNAQKPCKEFMREKEPEKKKEANEKSIAIKKKSEHISRSKKPTRCGGRRKRKSVSLEKFESTDQFEPTLKKPHENSCERCWKFASPSRSPVNKPDQKYDPNFRRGHSYMDLEKGDGDVVDKEPQLENLEPVIPNGREPSPSPCRVMQQKSHVAQSPSVPVTKKQGSVLQLSLRTPTKVKELLMNEQSLRKPLESYLPTVRTMDSSQVPITGLSECRGILLSDTKEKPRPRSCTPGLSPSKMYGCPNVSNHFVPTDYKSICMNPREHCDTFNTTFNTCPSVKFPESIRSSTFKESSVPSHRGSSSPGRSFNHSSLKPIPEASTASSKESETDSSGVMSSTKKLEKPEIPTPKSQSKTKNMKASSSKKPTSGATKSKGNQKPASSKAKNVHQATKSPKSHPQTSKSQTRSAKFECPQDFPENFCPDKKSQSTTNSDPQEYPYSSKPSCGNTAEHQRVSHAIRYCCCYPRVSKSKNTMDSESGHIFCCHCNWGENRNAQTNSHSHKSPFGIHPIHEDNVGFYPEPNIESNKRGCMKNQEFKSCDRSFTLKPSFPESSFMPSSRGMRSTSPNANAEFSERTVSCPYRGCMSQKMPSKFYTSPENDENPTWEKECQSSTKCKKASEDKEQFLGCSPRKYFVFYMTKSKEHSKGDDVEVLVEEFAQARADEKDAISKGIAEKMKKILECPGDSMALRFQKGVTETCKTPPSSRILYF